jgi:DNA repair exonuclease SbcCD nuclease subunit
MTPVFIIGDIHGQFPLLARQIALNEFKDCCLICVGDLGIGFNASREMELGNIAVLNECFGRRNIQFLSIRGNHDDPAFFNGDHFLSNFKLLPDYTGVMINDERFLFVGGAVSVDRKFRQFGLDKWEGEEFVLDESAVAECDVLITHTAPTWIGPNNRNHWFTNDDKLWEDCKRERDGVSKLVELCKPKYHYMGHFHEHSIVQRGGTVHRILDEFEIIEHRKQS